MSGEALRMRQNMDELEARLRSVSAVLLDPGLPDSYARQQGLRILLSDGVLVTKSGVSSGCARACSEELNFFQGAQS